MADNNLPLYLGETESTLFGPKVKLGRSSILNVKCKNIIYQSKTCRKISWSWNRSTCLRGGDGLKRKTKRLDLETMKLLPATLVYCHFDYACPSSHCGLTKKTKGKGQLSKQTH